MCWCGLGGWGRNTVFFFFTVPSDMFDYWCLSDPVINICNLGNKYDWLMEAGYCNRKLVVQILVLYLLMNSWYISKLNFMKESHTSISITSVLCREMIKCESFSPGTFCSTWEPFGEMRRKDKLEDTTMWFLKPNFILTLIAFPFACKPELG